MGISSSKILGTATLNEKGQLVIPAEARAEYDLKPGDKLIILKGSGKRALVLLKAEEIESMIKDLTNVLNG